MRKDIPLFILTLFLLALLSPSLVKAYQDPSSEVKEFLLEAVWQGEKRQFWDWGEEKSKIKMQKSKILGVSEVKLLPPPKGFLPGHPFYFLKRLRENLGLTFAFDPVKREEKRLKIAEERLAEGNKLLEEGRVELAQKTIADYTNQVSQVAKTLKTVPKEEKKRLLAEKLEVIAARHEAVLEKVLEKVPPQAKPAIKHAIEVSQKGMDWAADALGKPPVPKELKTRLEALKRQALLTPEEAAVIIASRSREEAREKIKHLFKEGKIPEADFKLLDEAQRLVVPAEFEKLREKKKIEELRKLEKQEPDETIKKEVEEFLKTYRVGDPIPPKISPYLPFQRIEELKETIKPEVLIGEEIKRGEFVGPGGCYNEETCRAYCSQPAHRKECLEFLKTAPEWIKKKAKPPADFEKYQQMMRELNCFDEASCRAICERDPERCEKFGFIPEGVPFGPRVGPGGCRSPKECERFCQDPANRDECERFGPPPEEMRRKPRGPAACQSEEECQAYCRDPAHRDECLEIWKKYGFPEGTPEFERQGPQEGGPGRREDWKRFCQMNPDAPECQAGPGGCRSEEECRRYCQENPQDPACGGGPREEGSSPEGPPPEEMPPEISPPLEFSPEEEMEEVKGWFSAGNKGPGGCNGVLSCFFYCSLPSNWQECRGF